MNLLCVLAVLCGATDARPMVTAATISVPPVIDGRLDDGEWRRAGAATGFTRFPGKTAAAAQPSSPLGLLTKFEPRPASLRLPMS